MNEKFVPPMTRKYNNALSVNAKLFEFGSFVTAL